MFYNLCLFFALCPREITKIANNIDTKAMREAFSYCNLTNDKSCMVMMERTYKTPNRVAYCNTRIGRFLVIILPMRCSERCGLLRAHIGFYQNESVNCYFCEKSVLIAIFSRQVGRKWKPELVLNALLWYNPRVKISGGSYGRITRQQA